MARIFIEGFETRSFINWSFTDSWAVGTKRHFAAAPSGMSGSWCLRSQSSTGGLFKYFDSSYTELYLAIKVMNIGNYPIMFFDSAWTNILTLTRNGTTRKLEARRGSYTGTLLGTSTSTIETDNVYLIECRYKPLNTDGIVQVKINGTLEIDITSGYDTTSGLENIFGIGLQGYLAYFDDLVIDDSSWIGDTKIQLLLPSAVGNSSQWIHDTAPMSDIHVDWGTEANAICSSYLGASYTAAKAFDNDPVSTHWQPAGSEQGYAGIYVSYIGIDLGSGNDEEIVGFSLVQNDGNSVMTQHTLSYSDNGTDWTHHQVYVIENNAPEIKYYGVDESPGSHRYWAVFAAGLTYAGTSYPWHVQEVEFFTQADIDNYKLVDEEWPVKVDFVQTNTADQIDTYGHEDLAGLITTIKCVQLTAYGRKTGSSPSVTNLRLVCRSGGTNYDNESDLPVPYLNNKTFNKIWEINPADAAAWEEADVAAAEFGIKSRS